MQNLEKVITDENLLKLALDSYTRNEDGTALAIIVCYINNQNPNLTPEEVTNELIKLTTEFLLEKLIEKNLIEYDMEKSTYTLKNNE